MTAIDTLLEQAQEPHPHFESIRGQYNIQNAMTEYEAVKLVMKCVAEGDIAGLFDMKTSQDAHINAKYRQNIRAAMATWNTIKNGE